jgi:hypothetical protein
VDEWDPNGYFKQKWAGPEWEGEWEYAEKHGIVQRNPESGLYEPVPGREIMAGQVVQQMNHALLARQQQWQQITQGNPYKQFYDVLYEPMQKAWQADVQKVIEQTFAQRETQSFVDKFESENAGWLYQQAPTGQRTMTEQGKAFYDAIGVLQDSGVTDPRKIVDLATKMVRASAPVAPAPAPTTAPAPAPAPTSEPAAAVSAQAPHALADAAGGTAGALTAQATATEPAPQAQAHDADAIQHTLIVRLPHGAGISGRQRVAWHESGHGTARHIAKACGAMCVTCDNVRVLIDWMGTHVIKARRVSHTWRVVVWHGLKTMLSCFQDTHGYVE